MRLFSTFASISLMKMDLMPCSDSPALVTAIWAASSQLFSDWARTSMTLTTDMIGLLSVRLRREAPWGSGPLIRRPLDCNSSASCLHCHCSISMLPSTPSSDSGHHVPQATRIGRGIAGLVVVKIAVDTMSGGGPAVEGPGPAGEGGGVVAALVGPAGAMQTDVDEVGGQFLGRGEAVQVVDAQGHPMA